MKVVFANMPAVVEAGCSLSHGIADGSTVTAASGGRAPTTRLPSVARHVGPPKCVATTFPLSSSRVASGVALGGVPPQVLPMQAYFCTPGAWPIRNPLFPAGTAFADGFGSGAALATCVVDNAAAAAASPTASVPSKRDGRNIEHQLLNWRMG